MVPGNWLRSKEDVPVVAVDVAVSLSLLLLLLLVVPVPVLVLVLLLLILSTNNIVESESFACVFEDVCRCLRVDLCVYVLLSQLVVANVYSVGI